MNCEKVGRDGSTRRRVKRDENDGRSGFSGEGSRSRTCQEIGRKDDSGEGG